MRNAPKILCVDDREENLFTLTQLLEPTKATILCAQSGNDALLTSLHHEIALAILDVEMPGMDGFEVAELLRQEERTKNLPIIFISAALSDDYHVFRGYEAGAVDFLVKPFNPTILLNKVRFFLQLYEQHQALLKKIELEETNHHLEAVLMSLTDAVFELSEAGLIRKVNRAAVELTGYQNDTLTGKPIAELFPSMVRSAGPTLNELTGAPNHIDFERREVHLITAAGVPVPVLLSSSPVETPSGRTKGIVLVALDLASKLKAEKERTQLVTAIQQSLDGIALLDTSGHITYTNPAFNELLGIEPSEAIHRTLGDFDAQGEDETSTTERHLQLNQGNAWHGYCRMHGLRELHRTAYEVEQSISPIRNAKGEVNSFVVLVRDLSRMRQLESELAQAQKMEAMGSLARGIAHDFNNILTPILGYTDLSLEVLSPDNEAVEFLHDAREAAARAAQLVKQILAFSQENVLDTEPMRLQKVIEEAANLLRGSLPSTIGLEVDLSSACGPVMAEQTQIHQVIMNLGTNAYHAMEDGGGRLQIGLREVSFEEPQSHNGLTLAAGSCAALTVRDTGCGIPEDLLSRVFDPFFSTKEKSKGSGLGLANVHRIVGSFGGAIRIVSEENEGTQFEVLLPLCRDDGTPHTITNRAAKPPRGHERILIVDDESPVAQFEAEVLRLLGYSVSVSNDSCAALRRFESMPNDFDMIITDLTMPGLTGIELAQRIHSIRADIPVLLCTGFADSRTVEKSLAAGIHSVLYKPLLPKELATGVRQTLDDCRHALAD